MASRHGFRTLNKTKSNGIGRSTIPSNYRGPGVKQIEPAFTETKKKPTIQTSGKNNKTTLDGILTQLNQNYERNMETVNPANIAGSYIYTSQYSEESMLDAKKRAEKGDLISKLYVLTGENLLDPMRETYARDSVNPHPVVAFSSGLVQFLPNVISTIPAGLQAFNLLQQDGAGVAKKGYQSIPGIITETLTAAKASPLAFAGTVTAGVAVGGAGLTGGVGRIRNPKVNPVTSTLPKSVSEITDVRYRNGYDKNKIRDSVVTPAGLTRKQRQAAEKRAKEEIVGSIVTGKSNLKRTKNTIPVSLQSLPKSVSEIANIGIEKGARKGFRDSTVTPAGWTRQQKKAAERKAVDDIVRNVVVRDGTLKVEKNAVPTFSNLKSASQTNPNSRSYIVNSKTEKSTTPTQKNKAKTTSPSLQRQKKTVIQGNVPSEFRAKVAPGYSADVQIRGNTFVLTPIEEGITLNSKIPSTLRPVSFDDVLQNLVKNQPLAIKTGDRMASVTKTESSARFPDYQPNVYRPISSEDYMASAIGGRRGKTDIYTYPFGIKRDYSPNTIPKSIKALNTDTLFKLIDKTVNPSPMRAQNLDAFKDNPRVKNVEVVEVGKASSARTLPPMIQPLKITKILEYVPTYQKTSFLTQKSKAIPKHTSTNSESPSSKSAAAVKIKPLGKSKEADKTVSAAGDSVVSLPQNTMLSGVGLVATSSIRISTSPDYIPVVVPLIPDKVIPGDESGITDEIIDEVGAGAASGDKGSTQISDSSNVNSLVSSVSDADAAVASPMMSLSTRRSTWVRTKKTRSSGQNKSTRTQERARGKTAVEASPLKERRRYKDTDVNKEDEKDKKKRKRKSKKYSKRQIVNPLPWLWDDNPKYSAKIPKVVKLVVVSDLLA